MLFNRFYQPDFDLETLEVVPNLILSQPFEMRLPLRWIAILFGHVDVDFAMTGGVHSGLDIIKAMMAGACVTTVTSEFLQKGIYRAGEMLSEMEKWMEEHDYSSVRQMKGSMSQKSVAEPAAFERANYMKVLSSYLIPSTCSFFRIEPAPTVHGSVEAGSSMAAYEGEGIVIYNTTL